MGIFVYGQKEIDHLKRRDKKLGAAIDRIGMIERTVTPDPFSALISSIVAQQISGKAAKTVWGRLETLLQEITPQRVDETEIGLIQQCGMSQRKAAYIKGSAAAALRGDVDFGALGAMNDRDIVKMLTSLSGVGVWTAEMLLIFSLARPDVLSFNDLAIRRGMMVLYGLKEISRERFETCRKRYSPYGSVASLYLWAVSAE